MFENSVFSPKRSLNTTAITLHSVLLSFLLLFSPSLSSLLSFLSRPPLYRIDWLCLLNPSLPLSLSNGCSIGCGGWEFREGRGWWVDEWGGGVHGWVVVVLSRSQLVPHWRCSYFILDVRGPNENKKIYLIMGGGYLHSKIRKSAAERKMQSSSRLMLEPGWLAGRRWVLLVWLLDPAERSITLPPAVS